MPLDGEVNTIESPTRAGFSKLAFLATSIGLPETAGPDAVAEKVMEYQVKVEQQILELGRELKEQADGNQRHLAAIAPVFDEMKALAEVLGLKPDLDPLVIVQNAADWIRIAKPQLDATSAVMKRIELLREVVGAEADKTPEYVATLAELKIRSANAERTMDAGRLAAIETKAREKPGLMEACVLLARVLEQTDGKNPRPAKNNFDVSIQEPDVLSIPGLLVNLKDLEAVCIKSEAVNPDMNG